MNRIIKEQFPSGQFFVNISEEDLQTRLDEGTAKAIPGMPLAFEAVVKPKRKRTTRKKKPTPSEADLLGEDQEYNTRDMKAK